MSNPLYDAAMENFIEDYLDEHPDADWTEAYSAWCQGGDDSYADYIADRVDEARQRMKDARI